MLPMVYCDVTKQVSPIRRYDANFMKQAVTIHQSIYKRDRLKYINSGYLWMVELLALCFMSPMLKIMTMYCFVITAKFKNMALIIH